MRQRRLQAGSGRRPHPSRLSLRRKRQLEPEVRAFAGFALEADAAAVRLDDVTRDGEAEPRAGDAALAGVGAEEPREEPRLVLLGDADALVAHPDPHDAADDLRHHLDAAAL